MQEIDRADIETSVSLPIKLKTVEANILWSIHLQVLLNQFLHHVAPGHDSFLHDLQHGIDHQLL